MVAGGAEEYYLGQGEAPGEWVGRSASRVELVGEATYLYERRFVKS